MIIIAQFRHYVKENGGRLEVHLFRLKQAVFDPAFGSFFQPGRWYLIESQNATPVMPNQPSPIEHRYPGCELMPLRWEEQGFRVVPRYDDPDEKVWVIRAGGYGDLFYLLPVLSCIAKRLRDPKEQLTLQTSMAAFPTTIPLRFFPFPSEIDALDKEAAILNMEDIPGELEHHNAGSTTARYARRAGLREEDLQWDGLFPEELKDKGLRLWRQWYGDKRPRIVMALTASAATRTLPTSLTIALAIWRNVALYFAGDTNMPLPFPHGRLKSPEEWMALVMAADGVIGVDTAPTHLSLLLRKPTFAIFGAIPSHLRVPEHLLGQHVRILNIRPNQPCPCLLNKPACPVTNQPICFALTALTKDILEMVAEFIVNLQ